jgi:2-polyprenyl-3-methyl-5-hydroxy-6-metoxy-1,4-benzoquinol methylase
LNKIPRSSAYLYNSPEFQYETADFIANFCSYCGYLKNSFEDNRVEIYSKNNYQIKKSASTAMSSNLSSIRDKILEITAVKDNIIRILEVGSGAGELAEWFANQGHDTNTIDLNVLEYENKKIKHTQGQMDENYVQSNPPYDLIIARHLLEHIDDPKQLLQLMKKSLTSNGLIYLEMPNGEASLKNYRIVDYFNDHIHHFIPDNLRVLAEINDLRLVEFFPILKSNHIGYFLKNNEFVVKQPAAQIEFSILDNLISSKTKLSELKEKLCNYSNIFIYGAGAHSTTFITQLDNDLKKKITGVWDKDPSKLNKYLPGTEICITFPGTATENKEQSVMVNTSVLYKDEIENYIRLDLNLQYPIIHL